MTNGRCRLHGGLSPGAPKGNKNAFKHGRYSADAIASQREIAALVRAMNASPGPRGIKTLDDWGDRLAAIALN